VGGSTCGSGLKVSRHAVRLSSLQPSGTISTGVSLPTRSAGKPGVPSQKFPQATATIDDWLTARWGPTEATMSFVIRDREADLQAPLGGKARALASLRQAGLPIPEWLGGPPDALHPNLALGPAGAPPLRP